MYYTLSINRMEQLVYKNISNCLHLYHINVLYKRKIMSILLFCYKILKMDFLFSVNKILIRMTNFIWIGQK